MTYVATRQKVHNRGVPPTTFLDELVAWGRIADSEIFALNAYDDVYSSVRSSLGPWKEGNHRRAVMLEVMRVLAGFESSWVWTAGRDVTNASSITPETIEAGAWQVSANSINFGPELKALVIRNVGSLDGNRFQAEMKTNHQFAMEYIARLLRRTTRHNGPVKRHEIDKWLKRDAVAEFQILLQTHAPNDPTRLNDLIAKWNSYRESVSEPSRYEQIASDLYKVRNPGWRGNPPLSFWPRYLLDPDDSMMAAVEHYFLCRSWVGSGKYPAWQVQAMNVIYDTGKMFGLAPRHNPNKPVSPLTAIQIAAKAAGIRDGSADLAKSGKKSPLISAPPKYY